MINILRKNLILNSIKKQNFKFKILLFQFIIVFISLNICFTLLISARLIKSNLDKLTDINNTAMVYINKDCDNDVDVIENLNKKLDVIRKTKGINKVSRYYKDEVLINDEIVNCIFLDNESMGVYNFKIDGSKDIFLESKDNIKVLISEDLKDKYKINDIINIDYNNKFQGQVIGYISYDSNFWSNRIGNDKSLEKIENSIIIPFDKKCYYDKNLEYKMFNKIIIKMDKLNNKEILEQIKEKGIINSYIGMTDFIKQIKNQNSQIIFFMCTFSILIGILSLLGFIGVVISYTSFRKKEYAIRLTIGSTLKELSILICGEIGVSIGIAFLISAIISAGINVLLSIKPYYISLLSLIPSLLVSIFILGIFIVVYMLFIKKKTINDLMRGN